MRPNGFRIVRRTQRWIHPDDDWLAQPPAAPPFDPAPFAGAYQFDSPAVRAGWWFHPPDDATGLVPEAAPEFDPAPFAGAYQADLSVIPATAWAVPPEHPWEGLEPPPEPPFDPAQGGMWEEQPGQERSLAIRWYQPEDAFEGLEPPFVPPPPELEQSVAAGIEGTIGDRLLARTHVWYQNDWHAPILPYDPAKQGPHSTPDLSLQDSWNWPVWYQPEDATEGLEPPAEAPFDPAPFAAAYQGDLHDAWLPARWFEVEQAEGLVPSAVFEPAEFAGAYQEQRTDRSIQPVWYQPEDDWLGQPPEAPFDPAPFAGLFGLDQVGTPLIWQAVIETEAGPLVSPEAQRAGLWVDEAPIRLPAWWHPGFDNESQAAILGIEPIFEGGLSPGGAASHDLPQATASHYRSGGSATHPSPGGSADHPKPEH